VASTRKVVGGEGNPAVAQAREVRAHLGLPVCTFSTYPCLHFHENLPHLQTAHKYWRFFFGWTAGPPNLSSHCCLTWAQLTKFAATQSTWMGAHLQLLHHPQWLVLMSGRAFSLQSQNQWMA